MMLTVAVGLAWIATCYRVWVSLTQRRTIWRTSFTVAMALTAVAFTLYLFRAPLDHTFGWWNLTGLVAHVIMVAGLGFLLIYLEALQMPRVPYRTAVFYLASALIVALIMIISWRVAPLHDRAVDDLVGLAGHRSVVVYCLAFWTFIGLALVIMARTCLGRGRVFRNEDTARSVSLLLIGLASIVAVPVVILWSASVLIEYVTGHQAATINAIGDAILPWPVLLAATGVLSLLAVPYFLAVSRSWQQWRRLRPLWQAMIIRYPEIDLPLKPSGGPLTRLQTRLERAIIEIHGALRLAPVDVSTGGDLPVETVAAALRNTGSGTRSAARALGRANTREADVRQLMELARAYGTRR